MEITKIYEFEAAHYLPHYDGICKHLHGHSYRLEVTVSGPVKMMGVKQGMVMDFSDLKKIIEGIPYCSSKKLDHSNLNKLYENPTAEIMAESIAFDLMSTLPEKISLRQVRLWETRTSYATWRFDQ